MSKARNTGNLNNSIQITPSGDIKFMHGENMLMQVSSSGTITTTGTISGSNALSASYAETGTSASYAASATSASYALNTTSASYAVNATSTSFAIQAQTASSADSLTVRGTLTAQTLVVQTITSSVSTITGSTNFGSLAANTHVFTGSVYMNTNGLFVSSSGNVGIGTTTPTYKFEVNGNGKFNSQLNVTSVLNVLKSDFSTTGGQLAYDSNINQLYLWNSISSGYFSIYTNSTERLTITSGGNVGIGVNNPFSKLDISTSTSQALCIGNNSDTITSGDLIGALSFVSRDASTYSSGGVTNIRSYAASTYNTGNVAADLRFYVSNGLQNTTAAALFGTEAMRISHEGKVGIGTTNPGYKLTVVSDTTAALSIQSTNTTVGSPMLDFYDNGRSQETVISSTDGTTTGTYIASYSNHPLLFGAYANSTPTARMVIATNGKIGIGTSSPDNSYQGLTIYGSDPSLRLKTSSASGWVWTEYVNNSGTNNFSMGVNQTTPYFGIKAGAGMDSVHFLMNSSGKIGINGNASTYSQLNIAGSTKINRSIYNWYQSYWTGNNTYWHMKTNMNAGLGGNIQYTMSLFKGYFYAYSSPPALEGTIVFHNWDGNFYNIGTTGNLFVTAYRSTDNYVVLVTYSGSGEAGLTLDWHQAYGYPFVEAQVTAAGLHGSTTGKY